MKTVRTFPVLDMSCAACAAKVDKTLNACPGVGRASVNFAAATATIEFDDEQCPPETLRTALRNVGYDLVIEAGDDSTRALKKLGEYRLRRLRRRAVIALALSLPVALLGMFFMKVPYVGWVMWVLSTPVVCWLGSDFFVGAWRQIRHRSANMDTLVAISTGVAYLFSISNLLFPRFWESRGITPHLYFEASSVVVAFVLLGRLLEERAKNNTSEAIAKLMDLRPVRVVRIGEEGRQEEIPVELLNPGDIVLVRPGERIAVDGQVTEGESYVDESMLTGEPVPVFKNASAKVFAGTLNGRGCFRFQATRTGNETMLARIIQSVEEAQGSKAPVQKLVDRIAAVFVPVVLIVAVVSFAAWVVFDPEEGVTHGLLAFVTVLVVACPCALGLATPTAVTVGIGKGAEYGILVKDAESLEMAVKIDTVVLDKTGTLTEGHPAVTDKVWLCENGEIDYAPLFRALESASEHPIAEAVVEALEFDPNVRVDRFENLPGKGIKGVINGGVYYAGNAALLREMGIDLTVDATAVVAKMEGKAETVVFFADDTRPLAVFGVTDRLKESAASAVAALKKLAIEVYMLTGDGERAAGEVARRTGIGHYRSSMLPAMKADFVRKLQSDGRRVAMVGDGINDSAALARADLSIAMGKGSDIAMDVAKMTLMSSDLMKIPEAIELSRATVRTVRQNLFWAFIYNVIGIPVAAGVLQPLCGFTLNPMIAGMAMAMSSVCVVSNSLRLKRVKTIGRNVSTNHKKIMKKMYLVEGMMCGHCRNHVEKALNRLEGVTADVTLDPPAASVIFSGREYSLDELQRVLSEEGDYRISEKPDQESL